MAAVATPPPPAYFDHTYYPGSQSSPLYSDIPDASELVLQSTPSSVIRTETNQSVEPDFIYKSDHMEVNVGSRTWGLRNPAYGHQGHVEGFVKLLGDKAHVTCVGARVWLIQPI